MDERLLKKYNIGKDTMLSAALEYASLGLAVFPLEFQGKKPATKHGLKDATTDPETIRDMFSKHPYSNIGMACGSQSGGIVVVDVDVDDQKGVDGRESVRDWEHEHGALPDTAMTLTGKGGNHYIYRTNRSTKSRIACKDGIDIRADGGYIVLPPSIHPNGTQYTWEYDLSDYGIQEANDSVIDLMNEGVEPGKEFKVPQEIKSGERNGTLYKLACSMQARGNGDAAIREAVKAENRDRCRPPLEDDEVERIVKSALSKPKGTAPYMAAQSGKKQTEPIEAVTFRQIEAMDLTPPKFLIEDVLPKGVCLLGGPPKIGKSWLALDIGIQVAQGGSVFGHRCKPSGVLYLALEDSYYRLKTRVLQLMQGEECPENFFMAIAADRVDPGKTDEGLYKQLDDFFKSHPDIELVIIDTLQMVTPSKQKGDDAYASAYTMLNSIRPFWQDRQIGFLLVHHTRKKSINDVDPFETFLGSQGLTGATDAMYIIQAKKDMDFCDFYGRGRDFEDVSLAIRRDETSCRWLAVGTPGEMQDLRERREYGNNLIVRELKWIMEQANGVPQDVRVKDLRGHIAEKYGECVGTSEKNFGTEIKMLQDKLYMYDNIVVTNLGYTTRGGEKGTYYRIAYGSGEKQT